MAVTMMPNNKETLVVFLAIVAGLATTMVSPVAGISGTATFYTPPYTPSACFGNAAEGTAIAAASEVFWNHGAACGDTYVVTCTGGTNAGVPQPCTGQSVTVKIVDLCPAGCRGTIDLSQEAFAVIADPDAGKIDIEYRKSVKEYGTKYPASVKFVTDARPAPIDRGEWAAVLKLCLRKTETKYDCEYFYSYELDGGGRYLKNLFWADTDSRMDFTETGDVAVFDTTCRTNRHGAHFVPFFGLSRHRTPVVLGCGVTADASLDSLVWLLRAFKLSTAQETPTSVITDDGDAVAGAVRAVFPKPNHRFCSSHVERGIEAHLGGSAAAAQNEFRALMCDDRACSQSQASLFQDRWYGFVARHGTAANQRWLDAMYGKRETWAAAFVHGKFFLGMANDQRTQCLATPLHGGLHDGMSLADLWGHADACTHALRADVAALDGQAAMSRIAVTTEHRCLEEHAARVFTPANFYLVREEIEMMGSFDVIMETHIQDAASREVRYYGVRFKQHQGVVFHIKRSGDDNDVVLKCSCRKMEREGLPCRHIFCVMRYTSMSRIPNCCALRRMKRRLDAKCDRLEEMKDLGSQVFDLASEDAQESREILKFFQTWLRHRGRFFQTYVEDKSDGSADAGANAVEDEDEDDADANADADEDEDEDDADEDEDDTDADAEEEEEEEENEDKDGDGDENEDEDEDDDGADADAESSPPVAKKMKLFDD